MQGNTTKFANCGQGPLRGCEDHQLGTIRCQDCLPMKGLPVGHLERDTCRTNCTTIRHASRHGLDFLERWFGIVLREPTLLPWRAQGHHTRTCVNSTTQELHEEEEAFRHRSPAVHHR